MKRRILRTGLASAGVAAALFLALTVHFYWAYRSVNLFGYPQRLTVRGRHFYLLEPGSETRSQAINDDPARPLHQVGTARPIPGLNWHVYEIHSRFDQGCPTSTYLRVAPNRYISYSLSGSC